MNAYISLHIRAVWSGPSLSVYRITGSLETENEDTDRSETAQMFRR